MLRVCRRAGHPLRCRLVEAQFDLPAELGQGVRDAVSAWRFIRLFAAGYASPIVPGQGYDDVELGQAEARLGVTLPASVRAAYALLGRRPDLTRCQDVLLTPHQLEFDETGRVLVFRLENQGCTQWGIPLSALGEADPPVVFRGVTAWHPFLERFSLACVEMVLSEWVVGGAPYGINCQPRDETFVLLEQRLRRLPLPDYPAWWWSAGGPVRWFETSGAVLLEHPGTWLWVRAPSPEGIAAMRQALPDEWSNSIERALARGCVQRARRLSGHRQHHDVRRSGPPRRAHDQRRSGWHPGSGMSGIR